MVLKRLFPSDMGEALALHIHCSDLPGDRALSQYYGFSGRIVLKMLYVSDT